MRAWRASVRLLRLLPNEQHGMSRRLPTKSLKSLWISTSSYGINNLYDAAICRSAIYRRRRQGYRPDHGPPVCDSAGRLGVDFCRVQTFRFRAVSVLFCCVVISDVRVCVHPHQWPAGSLLVAEHFSNFAAAEAQSLEKNFFAAKR